MQSDPEPTCVVCEERPRGHGDGSLCVPCRREYRMSTDFFSPIAWAARRARALALDRAAKAVLDLRHDYPRKVQTTLRFVAMVILGLKERA